QHQNKMLQHAEVRWAMLNLRPGRASRRDHCIACQLDGLLLVLLSQRGQQRVVEACATPEVMRHLLRVLVRGAPKQDCSVRERTIAEVAMSCVSFLCRSEDRAHVLLVEGEGAVPWLDCLRYVMKRCRPHLGDTSGATCFSDALLVANFILIAAPPEDE